MKLKLFVATACALTMLLSPGSLAAKKPKKDHEDAYAALRRGETLPVTQILAIAAQNVAGQVIKIELKMKGGRPAYELKVLAPGGLVRKVVLDARTGAVMSIG